VTSIDGGALVNFSSSGLEPFGIEDIDAFGAAASIASKSDSQQSRRELRRPVGINLKE
jgi:hypothetical protein